MSSDDFKDKGYLQEKALNTLKEIVAIVEDLNSFKRDIPSNVFNELEGGLRAALHDSTKVVATLYDSIQKQDWSDVDLILSTGTKGLDRVLFKYGCRPETEEMIMERERPAFARRVLELSKGDRNARGAIYEECHRFGRDHLTAQIDILLEGVTQNTKDWSQFQVEIDQLLSPFREDSARTTTA